MGDMQLARHVRLQDRITVHITRAIVRDDHFKILIRLQRQSSQYHQQRVAAVVGRDHHGDKLGGLHFELDYATAKIRRPHSEEAEY